MGQCEAANIYVIISEGEGVEKGTENTFEEISETTPNFVENVTLQIQEYQWTQSRIKTMETTTKNIIDQLLKAKENEILQAVRKEQVI